MTPPMTRHKPIPHLRWWIIGLLFLSTVINYVDRQTLSVLARTIQDDLGLSNQQYAYIVQAFLLAYTLSYLVSGRITDWLGTRVSMAAFIIWWSLANITTAFASSAFTLGISRFLLGVGEPGNYTAGPKAVSEWFTPRERGLAYGIYTMGATIGATIAPPLIAWLAVSYGWRAAFVITGALGLLWVIPWLWLYRPPHEHPRLGDAERRFVPAAEPAAELAAKPVASAPANGSNSATGEWARWRGLLNDRGTWLLLLSRLLTDPVWYFYLFWFPKYLSDARGLSLVEVGRVAWVVYLAADIGSVAGGWLSGRFIGRGLRPIAARKAVLRIAAIGVLVGPFVPFATSLPIVLLCAAGVALAHLAWQVTLSALIGYLVTHYSYTPVFVGMAVLHPLALVLVLFVRGERHHVTGAEAAA
jgi:ACS family hexuronate transporter-like MFS transporter